MQFVRSRRLISVAAPLCNLSDCKLQIHWIFGKAILNVRAFIDKRSIHRHRQIHIEMQLPSCYCRCRCCCAWRNIWAILISCTKPNTAEKSRIIWAIIKLAVPTDTTNRVRDEDRSEFQRKATRACESASVCVLCVCSVCECGVSAFA